MLIERELGKTASYARRLLMFIRVGGNDGRDGTAFIRQWKAQSACASWLPSAKLKEQASRYGVTAVAPNRPQVKQWVWAKDKVKGMEAETDERPGPHVVTLDYHGQIWCTCMAGVCQAPTCKHVDAQLALIEADILPEPQGA